MLYGTCVDLRDNLVVLTFYVGPGLTDDERDDLQAVGAMVVGDLTCDCLVEERFIRVADRREPLTTAGTWVLLQRGFVTVER
jgi:hypothetical protein